MDFSYLAPPPSVNLINHSKSYIRETKGEKEIRRIFYNVPYEQFQLQAIDGLRRLLRRHHVDNDFDDAQLLKFCYSGDFDLQKSLQKVRTYKQWMSDPKIQHCSSQAMAILEEGIFYSYGRDLEFRPIIIFNISRMDFSKYTVDDYYAALNTLLKPIKEYMFVPGKVENWVWIIDTESRLNLPVSSAATVIEKMSAVFSSTLHKMFVVNSNTLISLMYSGVKRFIHPETVSKIEVLTPEEKDRLLLYISPDELEVKHGGKLPNLSVYWPIKSTNKLVFGPASQFDRSQVNSRFIYEDSQINMKTEYYSIINDDDRFLQQKSRNGCCCSEASCLLF